MKLSPDFYQREDVVQISRELLGKYLFSRIDGIFTGGIITETEAYAGVGDKASHAYGNRRTARTEVMFMQGGFAYVYLCYGIHSLFNIVTNTQDIPHAVLVRGLYPTHGIQKILERRRKPKLDKKTCSGPGTVSEGLGIHFSHTGKSLAENEIWVEDKGLYIPDSQVIIGPRIGVDYAKEDALLPYRFLVKPGYLETLNIETHF
jgi:DNA-3-methyladenine glycosylase